LYPLVSLDGAFRRFFAKTAKHPKFKRKGQRDSFYVDNQKLRLDARSAKLPKIGRVKLTESLRFRGRVLHGTVSREAGRWFLSVTVELTEPDYRRTGDGVVGVDLGIAKLATLSTGEIIENPRPLQRRLARLQRLSQAHSRKVKGSRNRYKAARRLAQLHWRIRNVRQDTMHKLTTRLCRENQTVGIENLNVKGMVRNRKLARAISDAAFGEFRRQLTYKAALYGTRVVVVDRFYPSSKTCSACGVVNQGLVLSDRVFCCPTCGFTLDRDHNAAINLCAKAHEATPGMGGSYACGESVRPESLGYPAILVEAGSST
jgi:putative transposase